MENENTHTRAHTSPTEKEKEGEEIADSRACTADNKNSPSFHAAPSPMLFLNIFLHFSLGRASHISIPTGYRGEKGKARRQMGSKRRKDAGKMAPRKKSTVHFFFTHSFAPFLPTFRFLAPGFFQQNHAFPGPGKAKEYWGLSQLVFYMYAALFLGTEVCSYTLSKFEHIKILKITSILSYIP